MYQTDDWPALPPLSALVNRVHQMDALELLALLPDASVDAIITDLPYGTTACTWDTIIPFAPMWAAVKRVLKPRGVFVTTASQPFTSALVMSNPAWFKYEWIWDKVKPGNILAAKHTPLKSHENIVVFSGNANHYYPQMVKSNLRDYKMYSNSKTIDATLLSIEYERSNLYPKTILRYSNAVQIGKQHPTQKPIALYEYLISTYTLPGELVVDPCCGSGTTGAAARNLKRDYILNDSAAEYVEVARDRLRGAWDKPRFRASDLSDLPLFEGLAAVSE